MQIRLLEIAQIELDDSIEYYNSESHGSIDRCLWFHESGEISWRIAILTSGPTIDPTNYGLTSIAL